MSQFSQGSPFMDANQRNQVEDYSDGQLSSGNTGKSRQRRHKESFQSSGHFQQRHPSQESSDHIQQNQRPKESYQISDNLWQQNQTQESHQNSDNLQQKNRAKESYQSSDDDLRQKHHPKESYQSSDDDLRQKHHSKESYQTSDHLKQQHQPRKNSQSSDHLQQQHQAAQESSQSSDHLKKQHQPRESYQSSDHSEQKQTIVAPSEAHPVNNDSSLINKGASDQSASVTDHSRDAHPSGYQSSHSQTPWVEAPLTQEQNPNNYNHHRLLLYHEERDNSTEAWGENVPVRKASNKPKSSCCQ